MKRVITTIFFYFLIGNVIGQVDMQTILQKAIDLKSFQTHVNKQSIINSDEVKFIKSNPLIPDSLKLKYKGSDLDFFYVNETNSYKPAWSYEFIEIDIKEHQAFIHYKFYPHWNCLGGGCIMRIGSLFYEIKVMFEEKNKKWEISNHVIKDINFDDESDRNHAEYWSKNYVYLESTN